MTAQIVPVEAAQAPRRAPRSLDIKRRITAKVKAAVDAMVQQGLTRAQAAQAAGLADNSLYIALRKPEVKAYYLDQCEILRISGRSRRIHRLQEIAEQDENRNAAVQAIRTAELMDDPAVVSRGSQRSAGLVVVIQGSATVNSLISNDAASPARTSDVSSTLLDLDPSRGAGGKTGGR